ncbi:hypothetical protein MHH84_10965 [Bacillus sp. FSL K6-1109]|uniref:hypothetical protein n=1 Tax=Bacillus TaxID=1386 RepID=UPI0011A85CA5|nr:hypothetical protein [Bacillus licheniformis]MDE1457076.1 hypothetical protein [Bacillus licheniformis]
MLRDLEGLLLEIKKPHIKAYMSEALKCYYADSYRATIILATIAGMHDLREKIKSLASSMKEIRKLDDEIEKRVKKEENYETYMVQQARKVSILTESEENLILQYFDYRNRSAHPNEYKPSAEEARVIFTGYFDNIINKPTLLGAAYIQDIINRLKNENFIPNHELESVRIFVREELNKLHESAKVPLVSKLINTIEQETDTSSLIFKNATSFLKGVFVEQKDKENIGQITEKFARLIQHDKLSECVADIVATFPQLIVFLNEADKERLLFNFKKSVDVNIEKEKLKIIHSILNIDDAEALQKDKKQIVKLFIKEIEKSIKENSGVAELSSVEVLEKWVDKIKFLENAELDRSYFKTLIRLIDSGDFYVTNAAIKSLNNLDKDFINRRIDERSIVELFTAIINQARPERSSVFSYEARSLWDDRFKDYKDLYLMFVDYVANDYEKYCIFYNGVFEGKTALFTILIELNEPNLMKNVLDFMNKKHGGDDQLELDIFYHELKRLQRLLDETEGESWNEVELKVKKYMEALKLE